MALSPEQNWPDTPRPIIQRRALPRRQDFSDIRFVGPLVALFYICLIFPQEVNFDLAGAKITAYRAAIIVLIIPALSRFFAGSAQFLIPDALVTIGTLWVLIAFVNLFEPVEGIVRGSSIVLDTLGAYLIARSSIRGFDDVRRVLIMIAPGFFVIGLILAFEGLTHTIVYRRAFAAVFGSVNQYAGGEAIGALRYMNETRLGIMRGYASFSHPILAGVTLATLMPLYFLSGIRSWPFLMGMAAACLSFFSVSSVTFLLLAASIGMLLFHWFKDYLRFVTWPLVVSVGVLTLLALHLISESGIINFLIRYTFSPHNGFVRIIQWEAGFASMSQSPWIGIGYDRPAALPSWLPPSIDTHFLALSLRSGWITTAGIFGAALWIIADLGVRMSRFALRDRNFMIGVNLSILLWLIASMTVAFFGETNLYFMMMLGMGAALTQLRQPKARRQAQYPDLVPERAHG